MERSFKKEVQALKLGDGETFRGEGILAVTKALLQSGVSYVGGYQGAPVSHLLDVLVDAEDIMSDLGGHLEVDCRHQCRSRCAVEPRLARRDRRRDDHPWRRLRRGRERHSGTLLCL